jgi:hypothetical protein
MSSSSTDVKKYLEELFRLLNDGPDKSRVSDDMLRGIVRNFQEQYNYKYQEEEDFFKNKFATKDVDDILSKGGSSFVASEGERNALILAAKKDFSYDKLGAAEANAVKADIKLSTDREFSKVVKRISYALSNGYVDANRFLIWAIALASTKTIKYDLLLISLILRYGKAERNMYLLVPEYGNVHLLVYTVLELEKKLGRTEFKFKDTSIDNASINKILLLLTLLGSKSTSLAIYEEKVKFNEKGLPQYDSRILTEASKRDRRVYEVTVAQWLVSKRYKNYIEPENELNELNMTITPGTNEIKISYGLLTDNKDYAFPEGTNPIESKDVSFGKLRIEKRNPQQPSITDVIVYNAIDVGKYINIAHYIRSSESDVLRYCIDSLAEEVFDSCLKRGIKMSYFTVNRLCLAFKKATDSDKNKAKKVDSTIYLGMLLKCANYGVRIDKYQLDIIQDRNDNYKGGGKPVEQITKVYQQPLFKKVCSSGDKAPMPKSLILIADSLGALKLDNPDSATPKINKKETCDQLYKLFNDDPERIKEDAIARIKDRIRTTAYTLSEFTSGNINTIECENRPNNKDPLEYVDTALTYYKDDKNRLYCFPSFTYEDIQDSGFLNPITGERISVEAINRIRSQLEMFKKLNINANKIIPVETAAEFLKTDQYINNEHTKFAEDTIINMFRSRGVPEAILRNLNAETFNKILKIVSMCQGYLPELTKEHRFATFCKALYSFLKKNVEQVPYVLNAITVQQSTPLGPKPKSL